jgi:hypothetical protein
MWIYHILFTADATPILATTAGVYRGTLSPTAGPCLWDFAPSNTGFLPVSNLVFCLTSAGSEDLAQERVSVGRGGWGGLVCIVRGNLGCSRHNGALYSTVVVVVVVVVVRALQHLLDALEHLFGRVIFSLVRLLTLTFSSSFNVMAIDFKRHGKGQHYTGHGEFTL